MERNEAPWSPFESEEEWEFARWIMTLGVSQKKIDSLLKLKMVSFESRRMEENITIEQIREKTDPSFHNSQSLLQRIDSLPQGPSWTCLPF